MQSAKLTYTLATPAQVLAALDCDFAATATATKGKANDISQALITGTIKFTFVTRNSRGLSLSVPAVPVFAVGSIAPNIDASNLTETTSSDEIDISVDPGALTQCGTASTNKWLLSKVLFGGGQIHVDKVQTKVEFVVTKEAGAGLKLNIVPVAIGPQLSSKSVNTQLLSLVFDFKKKSENQTKKPSSATIPAPAAGSQPK